MIKVNVHDAKTHLSQYLERVEAGETLLLCRHNKPVAEVRPIAPKAARRVRKFGQHDGFGVSPEFFEPLPDEVLRAFEGESES